MTIIYRLLLIAVVLMAGYAGYKAYDTHQAYKIIEQPVINTSLGPKDAAITITEFFDYRCSGCRYMSPTVQTIMTQNPDVRFVFRHLPMYGEPSIKEARIALAAALQGKFKEAHDVLITRTAPLEDSEIAIFARSLGLDADKLQQDMASPAVQNTILQTLDIATRLKINSTPSFMLNKTLYSYTTQPPSVDDFQALINQARGKPVPKVKTATEPEKAPATPPAPKAQK